MASEPAYTRDREKCVVCGHFYACHDGLPPFKCMIGDCGCRVFVPRADLPTTVTP